MMRKILLQFVIAMVLAMFFVACGNSGTTEPAARDRERQESEENHVTNETGTLDPTPSPTPTLDPTPTPPPVQMLNVTIGEVIPFGGYDWRVLDVQGNYAKILTENVIFNRAYHNIWGNVTWATSDIRAYLNGTFFNSFSSTDRARIRQTTVINRDNQWFGTSGGANTTDRIFLLSIEEVVRYFGDSGQLRNRPNQDTWWIEDSYNNARIARNAEGTASWWWLRSPGLGSYYAASVGTNGGLSLYGRTVYWAGGGVRPALWLNLESEPPSTPDPAPTPTPLPVQTVSVGEIIQFGGYDWRVLDVQGNYAKILTENVIFNRAYHNTGEDVTWATSDIRAYLNGTFFNSFSAADRARIRQTTVINSDNQWSGTSGGTNTSDRIFLLSIEEVVRYFGDSGQLRNRPTQYTWWIDDRYNNVRIARNAEGTASWWWLRSPGNYSLFAANVDTIGILRMFGSIVSWAGGGVRPALWLNIESETPGAPDPAPTPTPAPTVEYITIQGEQFSTSLTSLALPDRGLGNDDIAPLRYMTNLTSLQLAGNQISNITPLSGLTNLRFLSLGDFDIDGVGTIRGNQISDLTPLSSLTNLTGLDLRGNQITDLAPISGLTNLTFLILEDNQIRNVTPLSGLTNLTHLTMNDNQISNVTPLAGLTGLTELSLRSNQITDITPLAGLTNLTWLQLPRNQITNITPLAGLTNLTSLGLIDNQITDITPLAGLTNLTSLFLTDNQITNITPLAGLANLTSLGLTDNQITNITPLAGLTNLTWLGLTDNQITDWSPVAHIATVHGRP